MPFPSTTTHHLLRAEGWRTGTMKKLLLIYVLPLFSWRRGWSAEETESTALDGIVNVRSSIVAHGHMHANQQSAVEVQESALLQHGTDLESGCIVETPPLAPQAPELRATEVVAVIGLGPPLRRQRLLMAANQASGITEEQVNMGLRHREDTTSLPEKLKEYLTLSLLIISVATGILINLFFVRSANNEPLSKNPSLIVACASAFVSLIFGFGLAIDTMKQMTTLSSSPSRHGLVRDSPCSWSSKLFLCLSVASITFTVISIIVSFLPKAYYYLAALLMPALLVLGVSFCDGHWRRNHVGDEDSHKDERDRSFQLAMNMTGFSFAGALGIIIGYHKNYSSSSHAYVSVSIYFMLGASITGLLVLLLSRLRRIDWKKAAVGNTIMLCLLVLAVLIVATTFLGGLLAGTLFPVAIAAAIWYFVEYHVPRGRGDLDAAFSREEELKLLYSPGALTAMSVSFGAVMTTFAGFLGGQGQPKGCSLKVFMFFVVSCFVSAVTLGVITFRTPKKASLGVAARAVACMTLVLFVVAGLAMVSYVG